MVFSGTGFFSLWLDHHAIQLIRQNLGSQITSMRVAQIWNTWFWLRGVSQTSSTRKSNYSGLWGGTDFVQSRGSPQKAGENLSSLLIFSLGSLWYRVLQGLGTHLKVIPTFAFCYNSRPSADYPLEWFLRNIKMGGFANTKPRRECNAKFETRGDKVYVVTTKPIRAGEEVFVFYHCKQQEDRMKLKLYKKKIAKRMNRKVWMNTKKKWREREQNIAIWPKNSIA